MISLCHIIKLTAKNDQIIFMKNIRIVITGTVGAGKSTFVRTASEIDVVEIERKVSNSEIESSFKDKTTVAFDFGKLVLDANKGDYLIWDQQFSANELRLPAERLLNSDQWKLIKEYHPDYAFKTLGEKYYRVLLFQRTEPGPGNKEFMQAWDSLATRYNLNRNEVTVQKFMDYEVLGMGVSIHEVMNAAGFQSSLALLRSQTLVQVVVLRDS